MSEVNDDEEAIDSSNELEELSSWKLEELIGSIKLLLDRFSIGVEDDEKSGVETDEEDTTKLLLDSSP